LQNSKGITQTGYAAADLVECYPELREDFGVFCPYGQGSRCREWPPLSSRSLEVAIIRLEDAHGLTREQVADWLEERTSKVDPGEVKDPS
jgi:hypothetical protein